ncbi:MAG: HD domain-containing phosphohydrolase, partial [Dehalococcoidia bacterium]
AILPYTDSEGGRIAAEKMRQAVERIFMLKSRTANIKLTLSGGLASYPKNAVSSEHLMTLAKDALISARTGGGNCICLAEEPASSVDLEKEIRARLLHSDTFMRSLDDEVSRCSRYGQKFSLILLSVTNLEVRGTAMDGVVRAEIMRTVFKLLNARLRTIDKSYLYTDSRYAVILPHTGNDGCIMFAQKLVQSLTGNPILRNDGHDINITVNAGISVFPTDAVSSEGLLRRTEAALSQAIKKGVNQIELASSAIGGMGKDGRDVNDVIARLKEAGPAAVYNLLAAVDVTEHYDRPHSHMVAKYAMATGSALGLPTLTIRRLRIMSLLHDLGKVCVPENAIIKPGPLVDKEWDTMMRHPQYCADVLKEFADFEFCCMPVLAHHERLDGKGYPRGLKGDQIPLESRIISVAEAYDDMVTPRPYRQQVSSTEALEELKNQSGSQFDSAVVKAFIKSLSSVESKV